MLAGVTVEKEAHLPASSNVNKDFNVKHQESSTRIFCQEQGRKLFVRALADQLRKLKKVGGTESCKFPTEFRQNAAHFRREKLRVLKIIYFRP